MTQKTIKTWIGFNAIVWFCTFTFLILFILLNFSSSTANMPPGGLQKINKMFFDIYLPFLGIVTGSLFSLSESKNRLPRNQFYPLFVSAMVVFFNIFIVISTLIFTIAPNFSVTDFINLIQSFNRYISFFLAGLITHFNLFF